MTFNVNGDTPLGSVHTELLALAIADIAKNGWSLYPLFGIAKSFVWTDPQDPFTPNIGVCSSDFDVTGSLV